jgi:predicted ArsR family transcriptional regulator
MGTPRSDSFRFAPRLEPTAPDRLHSVLRTCPYRDAIRENQASVCRLHKGITAGLLDQLDPHAKLSGFIAKDSLERDQAPGGVGMSRA